MRSAGIFAVFAAFAAPLALTAAVGAGLRVQNGDVRTMDGWSYKDCGVHEVLQDPFRKV